MPRTIVAADVDEELFRRFKATAILKNKTLKQAYDEALKLWLNQPEQETEWTTPDSKVGSKHSSLQ